MQTHVNFETLCLHCVFSAPERVENVLAGLKVGKFVDIKPWSSYVMWIDMMIISGIVVLEMVVCSECSTFTCPA